MGTLVLLSCLYREALLVEHGRSGLLTTIR